jgi:DUF4097 and DUF4098 domain-containing protein YvlB
MPTFATPQPISVSLELVAGAARIVASDRGDTVVAVHPSDPSSEADIKAAEQTRVEYANGKLLIKAPKRGSLFGQGSSIEVSIELPAGSDVQGDAAAAEIDGEGRLGACRLKLAAGGIRLDETGALRLNTALGDITVNRAVGPVDVSSGSGTVRMHEIDGTAAIKNANGDTWIGAVTGELRSSAANGDIAIDRADAAVDAKTALGSVRIADVVRGAVTLKTAAGSVEVGIREGTAAWLDVSTKFGHVRNSLEASDAPASGDTVEVRARTSYGDIVIHRS